MLIMEPPDEAEMQAKAKANSCEAKASKFLAETTTNQTWLKSVIAMQFAVWLNAGATTKAQQYSIININ